MADTKSRDCKVIFQCNNQDCENDGIYHVWYEDCESLPVGGCNIAYNTLCKECTAEQVINGKNGYNVACVKRIGC